MWKRHLVGLLGLAFGLSFANGCRKEGGTETAGVNSPASGDLKSLVMIDLNPKLRHRRLQNLAYSLSHYSQVGANAPNLATSNSSDAANTEPTEGETAPSEGDSTASPFDPAQCTWPEGAVDPGVMWKEARTCRVKVPYPAAGVVYVDWVVAEGEASLFPDGRIRYCERGALHESREEGQLRNLLKAAGATDEELTNVRIHISPTQEYNAWATLLENGTGVIHVSTGLFRAPDRKIKALSTDGELAAVLLHELGHIKDMRRSGFTNLYASAERVSQQCVNHEARARTCAEYMARIANCTNLMAADSRHYEHTADQNVAVGFERVKNNLTMNPCGIVDVFKTWGQDFDPLNYHPPGAERATYLNRALNDKGLRERPELNGDSWIQAVTRGLR
jgi:hypothetical protein